MGKHKRKKGEAQERQRCKNIPININDSCKHASDYVRAEEDQHSNLGVEISIVYSFSLSICMRCCQKRLRNFNPNIGQFFFVPSFCKTRESEGK